MRELMLLLDDAEADAPMVKGALDMAKRHQAFLTGLEVIPVYPSLVAVPEAIAMLDAHEQRARGREAWWNDLCRAQGVEGAWEVIRGVRAAVLAKRALLTDLLIAPLQVSDPDWPVGFDEITRALLTDVVPMLLVPDTWKGGLEARRILVAWNGSAEAAHAIKAALPLLAQAETVHVLDGEPPEASGLTPPPLPLSAWLQRQGVHGRWQPFNPEDGAGEALHDEALAMKADLIVMGAWGRPRISELILGGATRWLLERTSVPLFLAH